MLASRARIKSLHFSLIPNILPRTCAGAGLSFGGVERLPVRVGARTTEFPNPLPVVAVRRMNWIASNLGAPRRRCEKAPPIAPGGAFSLDDLAGAETWHRILTPSSGCKLKAAPAGGKEGALK